MKKRYTHFGFVRFNSLQYVIKSMGESTLESKKESFRGNQIEKSEDQYIYSDTKEPVSSTWLEKPCGYCGLNFTKEGHDGCLKTIPNVINACCGHGNEIDAYIQYETGKIIQGKEAIDELLKFKTQ